MNTITANPIPVRQVHQEESVHWVESESVTIRFKALCSRLRGEFVPDTDTFPDPRISVASMRVEANRRLPREPTRINDREHMLPNFEWLDATYKVILSGSKYCVIVPLTTSGVPTGEAGIIDASAHAAAKGIDVLTTYSRPNRRIPPSISSIILSGSPSMTINGRYVSTGTAGVLRPDLYMTMLSAGRLDLVPMRTFDSTWDPAKSKLRYLNVSPRGYAGSRSGKMNGPTGQPQAGFSARQFWARYCGGGYQVPHGEFDLITIGTDLVYTRGKTPKMRSTRGRSTWTRNTV